MLVATLGGNGLSRFAATRPPVVPGVSYLVSCQHPDSEIQPSVPEAVSGRDDIRVIFTPTRGLSVNRNHLLDNATGPLFLIADDDVVYTAESFREIMDAFERYHEADILTFRYSGPKLKIYPPEGHSLRQPWKNYYVSSIEIGGRLEAINRMQLRFSPLAGLGAPYLSAGEEALFIRLALKRGMTILHSAVTVGEHPDEPTGVRNASTGSLRARGAVIALTNPWTAIARIPYRAWADRRTTPPFRHFAAMSAGAFYALRHHRRL